jgi:curved DNA-binding protein CbpA
MQSCACGNLADGNGTMCHRCAALYELGLGPGATDAEVKAAYRLYVKAWHPDRFPGDEKSKIAAQEKLKNINAAYDYLTSSSSKGQTYRPKAAPQPHEPNQQRQGSTRQPPPGEGRSQASSPKQGTDRVVPPPKPSVARRRGISVGSLVGRLRRAPLWAAPAVVLLATAFACVWIYWPNPPENPDANVRDFNIPKRATPAATIEVPKGLTLDNPSQAAFSLPNGAEIRKRRHVNGRGDLTVENGTLDDAVVNLVDLNSEKTLRTFYIKTDSTFTERQIPPGLYAVYFTTGIDWNVASMTFNLNASYSHFGKNLEYTERVDENAEKVEKITYKITLQPVEGGNAEIESSDKDSFEKLMNDGAKD